MEDRRRKDSGDKAPKHLQDLPGKAIGLETASALAKGQVRWQLRTLHKPAE